MSEETLLTVGRLVQLLTGGSNPERHHDDLVSIVLSQPSMGPCAQAHISFASHGFDWEKGKFLITPNVPLVVRSEKQHVWQMAHDWIYMASQERSYKGNPTKRAQHAQRILDEAAKCKTKN